MEWSAAIIGIFAGVIAGVLVNIATYLFVSVGLPKYRDVVYQGTRVDGNWVIWQSDTPTDGEPFTTIWTLSAKLEQKAYELEGHATANLMDDGKCKDVINYEIDGYVYDRFVSVVIRHKMKSRLAHSVFLLELKGDGTKMTGYRVFYGLRAETIRAVECSWQRGSREAASCHAE